MPFRMGRDEAEVLLVTSRETKRWILPKGNPERKKKSYEVAAAEAFEEAGLKGKASEKPFYTFDSVKRMKSGKMVPCRVRVFSLAVKKEYARWPEKDERERAWMSFAEAANNAGEAGLVLLFLELAADPDLALEKIKPKLKAKAKAKPKLKAKAKAKPKLKAKAKAKPKLKAKAKAKPKLKAKAKTKPKLKAKLKVKSKQKPKTKTKKGAA
ncbi:MAG: NUDIX domain-containing protein [Alphaproteobacteria bacterium]|nr:NUDIX domain-containing protein [Alphaproteobacteria bacterium]